MSHSDVLPDAPAPPELLLVDDSVVDVKLAEAALRISGTPIRMSTASDGEEALAFLRQRLEGGAEPRDCLVLLDLNMPVLDGVATLREIRQDPGLCPTPVVMLTTSNADTDIARSHDAGADGYVRKPIHLNAFVTFFRDIKSLWPARVPPNEPS